MVADRDRGAGVICIPRSLPRAHTLAGAQRLRIRYTEDTGYGHHVVLGDCTEDRQTYYIGTRRELRPLIEAGYELLEVTA